MAVNLLDKSSINQSLLSDEDQFGRDWHVKRFMHILYGVLASLAILGNFMVCFVIVTTKNGRMMKSGLNLLILSMAMMDAATGIMMFVVPSFVVPAADYTYPSNNISGTIFCRVFASQYAIFYFGFGSVFTITAIAIERWIAVARPYTYRNIVTIKRTKRFLVGLWVFNTVISIDILLQRDYDSNEQPPCKWNSFIRHPPGQYLFIVMEILRLFLPFIIIIACYIDIIRRIITAIPGLSVAKANWNRASSMLVIVRNPSSIRARRRVTIMVAISALAFMICWLPNEFYFTLYVLNVIPYNIDVIRFTKTLIVVSSCLSPLIYSATNEDYRQGIWALVSSCKFRKSPRIDTKYPQKSILNVENSRNIVTQQTHETEGSN
ncbi:Mu-type opioid receptor [Trichoplax sp. H2]|nr:Mu-type opioid receptor [Trichoplax sp. H2]|eukprot:RDD39617.1 Mu-type opioid receptor [Trichoplax sp. H2]